MSESETKGRCRRDIDKCLSRNDLFDSQAMLADAIDRIAADVAEIKAKVDSVEPEDVRHFVESEKAWVTLVEEQRDAARCALADAQAEIERLRAELAAQPKAAGWLTEDERQILKNLLLYQWGGLGWLARVAPALRAILDRAGSPPVVEVPVMTREVGDANTHMGQYMRGRRDAAVSYRDALDAAGIPWKEAPRE